jgi:hypothetical protein
LFYFQPESIVLGSEHEPKVNTIFVICLNTYLVMKGLNTYKKELDLPWVVSLRGLSGSFLTVLQ